MPGSNTRKVLKKPIFGSAPKSKSRSKSKSKSKSRSRRRASAAKKAAAAAENAFKEHAANPFFNDPRRARATAAATRAKAAAKAAFNEYEQEEAYKVRMGLKKPAKKEKEKEKKTRRAFGEENAKKLFAASNEARAKLLELTVGAPAKREANALAIQKKAYEERMRAEFAAQAARELYREQKAALDETLQRVLHRNSPSDGEMEDLAAAELKQWKEEERKKMAVTMKGK